MGLTPMDLFNDILTNENDLRNFLQQSDVKNVSSSSPGIIIQGNTFTKHADNHLWRPLFSLFGLCQENQRQLSRSNLGAIQQQ